MAEPDATAALIHALVAGEADAHARFVELWGPVVLRWCVRLGGPGIDAEDAAHDTFERAFARVHTLREPRALPGWLYQLTRRTLLDYRRQAWLRRWVPGAAPEGRSERAGPDRETADADLARKVHAAIDALPTELREVLVLCEVEERSGPEVAELVGIPLGTVKSRLRRALERFGDEARKRGLTPDVVLRDADAEAK